MCLVLVDISSSNIFHKKLRLKKKIIMKDIIGGTGMNGLTKYMKCTHCLTYMKMYLKHPNILRHS